MNQSVLKTLAAVSMAALSGCSTYGNWMPTVDPYGDPNAYRIQQDLAECRQLALQSSGGTASRAVTGGLVGGAIGAAAGAAIGAATGADPGAGAAIGAATAGMGGGVYEGMSSEEVYRNAYARCMRYRGHRVLNY